MSRCQKVQDGSSEFELGARLTSETSGEMDPKPGGETPGPRGREPMDAWRAEGRFLFGSSLQIRTRKLLEDPVEGYSTYKYKALKFTLGLRALF